MKKVGADARVSREITETGSRLMAKLEVHQFPARSDNYGVLIHDPETGATASIDAPDADAVLAALEEKGWTLTHILITHHHGDHTAGNKRLKALTGCIIVGPKVEARSIPAIDVEVSEGDSVAVGKANGLIIETPGHTRGHISYLFPEDGIVFVGDTLFSVGCGKLLEGDAKMMWRSLQKLMALPPETQLYCGHEYTRANTKFALTVEPGNAALQARAVEAEELAKKKEPALPTSIGRELATNPFLRPSSPEIQKRLGMEGRELWEIFGETRRRKDRF
jgi:hydroxyacylglutathione hydrolase